MKELKRFMRYRLIQYQRNKANKNTENIQKINEWVLMKNYAPFSINETKLQMI